MLKVFSSSWLIEVLTRLYAAYDALAPSYFLFFKDKLKDWRATRENLTSSQTVFIFFYFVFVRRATFASYGFKWGSLRFLRFHIFLPVFFCVYAWQLQFKRGLLQSFAQRLGGRLLRHLNYFSGNNFFASCFLARQLMAPEKFIRMEN